MPGRGSMTSSLNSRQVQKGGEVRCGGEGGRGSRNGLVGGVGVGWISVASASRLSFDLKDCLIWGAWVAPLVERPALDFGSGHDLTVA